MRVPSLSIIIITLNEEARLPRLLDDLESQTFRDFEIIHVDSASTDRTAEISATRAHRFSQHRIIEMSRRGVSLGRNTGAQHALGERILFLDADTRIVPDFLERSLDELEKREVDVAGVLIETRGLPLAHRIGLSIFNGGIFVSRHIFPTAIGACLFSTRSAHLEIGGFDERLHLCEDCNYVLKAHRNPAFGYDILTPRFHFDLRRLQQDGFFRTGWLYLKANLHRFFKGELTRQEISYPFGHYG